MSTQSASPPAAKEPAASKYPAWYRTLFALDTLERFGFYGMQAILVLYAAAPVSRGGLGLHIADAASLFGAWIALMFMLSLPGGWIGDRLLGHRPALLTGASISVLGYVCLSLPGGSLTAVGLVLLAVGGGVYKPNHQALLNLMYGSNVGRREAGISLMYTGVQISALLAPLVTGYLGERVNWHLGFAAAGLSMLIVAGVVAKTAAQFDDVGGKPGRPLSPEERRKVFNRTAAVLAVLAVLVILAAFAGALSAGMAIGVTGLFSVLLPVVGYVSIYRNRGLSSGDRRRLRGFLAVFLGATLFWMIIAHAASLLNLFAQDHVNRELFGWTIPASWMIAATPAFILVLAPVFAWLLPRIGKQNNVGVKFSLGLTLVGGSFLLMAVAAAIAADGTKVSPLWLVVVYLAHACGELIIAALTIAAIGEVLPRQYMGRALGLLWLFAALGGGLGAGVVRLAEVMPEQIYYLGLGTVASLVGLAFALGRRKLTRALAKDDDPQLEPEPAKVPAAVN